MKKQLLISVLLLPMFSFSQKLEVQLAKSLFTKGDLVANNFAFKYTNPLIKNVGLAIQYAYSQSIINLEETAPSFTISNGGISASRLSLGPEIGCLKNHFHFQASIVFEDYKQYSTGGIFSVNDPNISPTPVYLTQQTTLNTSRTLGYSFGANYQARIKKIGFGPQASFIKTKNNAEIALGVITAVHF